MTARRQNEKERGKGREADKWTEGTKRGRRRREGDNISKKEPACLNSALRLEEVESGRGTPDSKSFALSLIFLMTRIKKSDLSGANHPPGRGEDGEEEDVVGEGDEPVAAQVVEDGVAPEVLVQVLADPAGLDLPELVEAQPLRLLHARRQGAQEVLGRHENLRQRSNGL